MPNAGLGRLRRGASRHNDYGLDRLLRYLTLSLSFRAVTQVMSVTEVVTALHLPLRAVEIRSMSKRATLFIATTAAIGASVLAYAMTHWQSTGVERFVCYLLIALLSSGLKVQLPGIDGTMSVNFL